MSTLLQSSSGVAKRTPNRAYVAETGFWTIVVLVMLLSAAPESIAATRIELVIDEAAAGRTVLWPITTGVPFPRGALRDGENCRLVDDQGNETLLQSRVAATWDAERTSIRWLTIDFLAQPGRSYALEFGQEVQRKRFDSALVIAEGTTIRVDTGALAAEFTKNSPSALTKVCADLDGNGTIGPDETIVTGSDDGDHYYVDQHGRRFTSSRDGEERQVVVETSGQVRTCIRVDGFYTGPDDSRTFHYRTRYHFFAGLGLVKLVDEFRIVGSTRGVKFTEIGLAWKMLIATADRVVSVDASGDDGNQPLRTAWRPETSSIASFQSTHRHYGNPQCHAAVVETGPQGERLLAETERMGEWMQVADRRAAVTGSLRWFWQQFPKSWEATSDRLILQLWSPRGGELDFSEPGIKNFFGPLGRHYLLEAYPKPYTEPTGLYMMDGTAAALVRNDADGRGISKHHEVYLHFAPAGQAEQAQEYAALAAQQPLALASGEWNCGTDVFGPLAPRPNDSKYEAIVDRIFDLSRYAQDAFGDYGWWVFGSGPHYSYQWDADRKRHYADPRRFEYHTYQKETQLWWCYLRSGERKFYDWAIPSENHWVDVSVSHQKLTCESQWHGGEPRRQTLDWPPGDWSIDGAAHYLRHHHTGEAWLRGGSQFWATYHRTLETTTLAHYLTGDERYSEVLEYWRSYFADLAGKTSASTDIQPWHRQQPWFHPTATGEPTRTWAEMIRDYAPFDAGSRHQMTLLFNLATLYEHTWDPHIGQALREYANAFLDTDHPLGVWRSQDHCLPAHAEAPIMAHYWIPALWKYARATQDPRMPDIFARYFAACLQADPFREDVGVYSNVQIAYGYYFTRDPRHLRPVLRELDRLWPNAAALKEPQDINERLYNPYAPIAALTAAPRLIWALKAAERDGVSIPLPEPLGLQRSAIAIHKSTGAPVSMTLWGFDRTIKLLGPQGDAFTEAEIATQRGVSQLQPMDRTTTGYEVFTHKLTIPAGAPEGYYVLVPKLELAMLDLRGAEGVLCNAAQPVSIQPGERWAVAAPDAARQLVLESEQVALLRVSGPQRELTPTEKTGASVRFDLAPDGAAGDYHIENTGRSATWCRIANLPEEQCWMSSVGVPVKTFPTRQQSLAAVSPPLSVDPAARFVEGRFGQAVQLSSELQLHFPDYISTGETAVPLFDMQQGTLEFWVRKLWDDRLRSIPPVTLLTNGYVHVTNPGKLPIGEWSHVALVWRPAQRESGRTLVHVYVDGVDTANYRNLWWPDYGSRPVEFSRPDKLPGEFVSRLPAGAAVALDELRVSSTARYANREIEFGHRQTYNPVRFDPQSSPFAADEQTLLLLHFDGDFKSSYARGGSAIEARFSK